ncbi:MAG: MTH938/NDUFAF3 family protein [Candidatus Hermodarchaeota archaeon]
MIFEKTSFGSITVSGKTYDHDVCLFVGENALQKRDKSHSKHIHGHRELSRWELEKLLEGKPEVLLIGTGQSGVLPMRKETQTWLESVEQEQDIQIIQDITPNIIVKTNELLKSGKRIAGIFHITC